jgi:hypothetical protein
MPGFSARGAFALTWLRCAALDCVYLLPEREWHLEAALCIHKATLSSRD